MKYLLCFIMVLLCSISCLFSQDIENIKDQKPVVFTGAISSQFGLYQATGIAPRSSTSFWNLRANANLNFWNTIELPFSVTFGRSGSRLNYPSFAQFGMSPKYKSVTAHLGYRNLDFSDYTLAGHTFLGAAIEINKPGQIRLAVMRGRLRDAAEVDTTRSFVEPVFKRNAFALKLGTGTEKNFVDFILLKGKDDENSLEELAQTNLDAAENLVLGMKSKVSIGRSICFDLDVAGSAFTRNQKSAEVERDSRANDFLFLVPPSVFKARTSSRFNLAGKAGITYSNRVASVNVNYERVDPEYETMGAYFFANDIERYTISSNFQLFKNKVGVGGSYGIQKNNLLKNRLETTTRNVGSGFVDIHPNANWGVNINFSNYDIYQESGTVGLDDTLAFNLSTTTASIMPRVTISGEKTTQHWSLVGNYQLSNQDNQAFFENSQQFESTLISLNHSLIFLANQLSINSGLNYNEFNVADTETTLFGGVLGLGTSFSNNKMMVNLSTSYNKRLLNQQANGHTISAYLNYTFAPNSTHRFTANLGLLKSIGAIGNEFSETRGSLSYAYIFNKTETGK